MRPLAALALALFLLFVPASAGAVTTADTPDPTWMVEGSRVQDIVATDERVFVGGEFDQAIPAVGEIGVPAANLLAFDASTGSPAWVQTVGSASGTRSKVWDIDLSGNGQTLLVCGEFESVGGEERSNVAAVDAMTGNVLAWAPAMPVCRSIERRGGMVFAGSGRSVRALGADGSTAWVSPTDGPVLTLETSEAALYAGGRFSHVGAAARPLVARIDPLNGTVDTTWGLDPVPATNAGEGAFAIDLMVRGGTLFLGAGGADYAARFDLDTGGLAWWRDTSGSVQKLELVGDTLVLGGHFQWVADDDTMECGTNQAPVETCSPRMRLAAVDARTGHLDAWAPRVTGAYTGVWALDLDAMDRLHVGGGFSEIGGVEQHDYARLSVRTAGACMKDIPPDPRRDRAAREPDRRRARRLP